MNTSTYHVQPGEVQTLRVAWTPSSMAVGHGAWRGHRLCPRSGHSWKDAVQEGIPCHVGTGGQPVPTDTTSRPVPVPTKRGAGPHPESAADPLPPPSLFTCSPQARGAHVGPWRPHPTPEPRAIHHRTAGPRQQPSTHAHPGSPLKYYILPEHSEINDTNFKRGKGGETGEEEPREAPASSTAFQSPQFLATWRQVLRPERAPNLGWGDQDTTEAPLPGQEPAPQHPGPA